MAYHWAPSDHMYVWDQMPKSAACSLMACAFMVERMDHRWGLTFAVVAAVSLNMLGGIWWLMSPFWFGVGDLRPLIWLEFMPTLLVAAGAWSLPGRLLTRENWMRALASFMVAQTADWADAPIYSALGGLSGHSVRHLSLAVCVGWIAYRLGCVGAQQVGLIRVSKSSTAHDLAGGASVTAETQGRGDIEMDAAWSSGAGFVSRNRR